MGIALYCFLVVVFARCQKVSQSDGGHRGVQQHRAGRVHQGGLPDEPASAGAGHHHAGGPDHTQRGQPTHRTTHWGLHGVGPGPHQRPVLSDQSQVSCGRQSSTL